MIFGEYPCCGGHLCIPMPDLTPAYSRKACPHCGAIVWHRLERVEPMSWVEAEFLEEHDVDEENMRVTEKSTHLKFSLNYATMGHRNAAMLPRIHEDANRTDVRGFPLELVRMVQREEYIAQEVVDAVIAYLDE